MLSIDAKKPRIVNIEMHIGVVLKNRSVKYPVATPIKIPEIISAINVKNIPFDFFTEAGGINFCSNFSIRCFISVFVRKLLIALIDCSNISYLKN